MTALEAARLGRAAGFRNLVVHAYADLDLARVHETARYGPDDLLAFLAALRRHAEAHRESWPRALAQAIQIGPRGLTCLRAHGRVPVVAIAITAAEVGYGITRLPDDAGMAAGRWISALDAQIAAIRRAHGATLVTPNVIDFDEAGVPLVDP